MSRFKSGFLSFAQSGAFSDVVIVLGTRKYLAHRLILSFSSEFFKKLFSVSDFAESSKREIDIHFPDPRVVFPNVLEFMYQGRLIVNVDNVIPLLTAADQFLVRALGEECEKFIKRTLGKSTVLALLRDALEFKQDDIVNKCLDVLAKNFLFIHGQNINWIPIHVLQQLLSNPRLAVSDEWALFQTLCSYLDAYPDLSEDIVEDLMKRVRWRWLKSEQLSQAMSNPKVPKKLLIEAGMLKLRDIEGANKPLPFKLQDRHQRRKWCGVQFEYNPQSPLKGILYWLGTNMEKEPWHNPIQSGIVRFRISSVQKGDSNSFLSLEPFVLWTQDVPASWLCIELVGWKVCPHAYSLRHGGNFPGDLLRNWDFQGSNDGKTWNLLKRHSNDTSLKESFQVVTWTVDNVTTYNWFRIIQTGHNSSSHNYLALSGFELFGELWEVDEEDLDDQALA
eukprot:TRINITY_DN6433_c0_g1_i1.p1 TRINITY_DN6433_c0_g1~~TRINITY_DN6433_c0_g1_i1.p1  ORF type:complete len:448 (+),score=56.23 TRINITY_DN6433_c0_g1_i1:75-1418(+)